MWARIGQAFAKYLLLPLLMEVGKGIVGLVSGWFAAWAEKRRKTAELKRLAGMEKALAKLAEADSEKEFEDAQREVVANKPK